MPRKKLSSFFLSSVTDPSNHRKCASLPEIATFKKRVYPFRTPKSSGSSSTGATGKGPWASSSVSRQVLSRLKEAASSNTTNSKAHLASAEDSAVEISKARSSILCGSVLEHVPSSDTASDMVHEAEISCPLTVAPSDKPALPERDNIVSAGSAPSQVASDKAAGRSGDVCVKGTGDPLQHAAYGLVASYLKALQTKHKFPTAIAFQDSSKAILNAIDSIGVPSDFWEELSQEILSNLEQMESSCANDRVSLKYVLPKHRLEEAIEGLIAKNDILESFKRSQSELRQRLSAKIEQTNMEIKRLSKEKDLMASNLGRCEDSLVIVDNEVKESLERIQQYQTEINSLKKLEEDSQAEAATQVEKQAAALWDTIEEFLQQY